MPNTPPMQIDERNVKSAPTDAQAIQADVLNYTEFLTQILEQHYRQYHKNMLTGNSLRYEGELSQYAKDQLASMEDGTANLMKFRIQKGKKFLKVIQQEFDTFQDRNEYRDGSVHAFIDKNTGDVYKPAGWNGRAKHVRYNLPDPKSRELCYINADWVGSYLYLR